MPAYIEETVFKPIQYNTQFNMTSTINKSCYVYVHVVVARNRFGEKFLYPYCISLKQLHMPVYRNTIAQIKIIVIFIANQKAGL